MDEKTLALKQELIDFCEKHKIVGLKYIVEELQNERELFLASMIIGNEEFLDHNMEFDDSAFREKLKEKTGFAFPNW